MSIALYFDVHVRRAIADGLRLRGVDVLTAQEDGTTEWSDSDLLDRARELGRVMFTHDEDFLQEATRRQGTGEAFAGVIYVHQLNVTIGRCISDLELIAGIYEPEDIEDRVEFLPL